MVMWFIAINSLYIDKTNFKTFITNNKLITGTNICYYDQSVQ